MARQIEISLTKRNVRGVATFLEEDAPRTCNAVWDALPLGRGRVSRPLGRPRGLYAGAAVRHRSGQGERHDSADRRGLALFRDSRRRRSIYRRSGAPGSLSSTLHSFTGATTFCSAPQAIRRAICSPQSAKIWKVWPKLARASGARASLESAWLSDVSSEEPA